jgi:UDP:flavonoid glycosyltransferase YjiC (YdhE family)
MGPAEKAGKAGGAVAAGGAGEVVLLFTSNGVGMGHLARAIAIARRLTPAFRPVVATLSQAFAVCRGFGLHAEHLPYHRQFGAAPGPWNESLARELGLMVDMYGARALVFDGTVPYGGLLAAMGARPGLPAVWCRIGMWRERPEAALLAQERRFALVVEPGELAAAYDAGPSRRHRDRTVTVPPIRLLDDGELLPRATARAELGLDPDRPAVLVALGSGNNLARGDLVRRVVDHLLARGDVGVAVAAWLMADGEPELDPRARRLDGFPHARWLNAFDAAVSAASYGLYHELAAALVPTLFVPNEHPENDDQLARARFARDRGFGACVRAGEADEAALGAVLDDLLEPASLAACRVVLDGLDRRNGASAAAAIVATLARGSA